MTQEQDGKCQVKMFGGSVCGRDKYSDDPEKCVCHSELYDKDNSLFTEEVIDVFKNREATIYDLVSFVFPKLFMWLLLPRSYDKAVSFRGAVFLGDMSFLTVKFAEADFIGVNFHGEATFLACTFKSTVHFNKTVFRGKASFVKCDFEGEVRFSSTVFEKEVSFWRAKVLRSACLYFDERAEDGTEATTFGEEVDFREISLSPEAQVRFHGTNLSKCRLVGTDLSQFHFLGVEWPRELRWPGTWLKWCLFTRWIANKLSWFYFRAVYDEELARKQATIWKPVEELYQQIQRNYVGHYKYVEAGDFYVGEQEMIRKAKGKWIQYFCANNGYRLISFYGESYVLPLFWMAVTLMLYPILLLSNGIALSPDRPCVNYAFDVSGEFVFFSADYWTAFGKNLLFLTFNRSDVAIFLPSTYQQVFVAFESIWMVVLVTFFVLALRRRFRRKSF